MLKISKKLQGIMALFWLATMTFLLSLMILVVYIISLVMPYTIRVKLIQFLSKSPFYWVILNKPVLYKLNAKDWAKAYPKHLDSNGIYLVMSNHQSWSDIIILLSVFNQKITPLKFFMKKELAWQLPIIGLACKAIGFPMLSRHTKDAIKKNPKLKNKDKESTIQACASVKQNPSSLLIFPEGSRFTKKKQTHQDSPYQHLLKPKAGGVSMIVNGLKDDLRGILDVTIDFGQHPHHKKISLWNFVTGAFPSIQVTIELLPIHKNLQSNDEEDKEYRKVIHGWLSERWQMKDKQLSKKKSNE
jgi:1-acyl-sn-glycerol-3-phosphate acyltransferase